jgi:hypothetical protein
MVFNVMAQALLFTKHEYWNTEKAQAELCDYAIYTDDIKITEVNIYGNGVNFTEMVIMFL